MEDQDPNKPPGNSAVGSSGLSVAAQSLEESRHEETRPPTAVFESSEGRGLQQGIGNTMIVHSYGNSAAAVRQSENNATSSQSISLKDKMVSVTVGVLVVAVIVAGYLNSAPNIQSRSLPSIAPGFTGRDNELDHILHAIVITNHPGPNVVNIVGAPGFGKSALAIAVGHALLRHGVYVHYVDIYHLDKVKVAVTAILATVIDGVESSDPQQLFRWAGRLQAHTVLILDNCDSLLSSEPRDEFLNFLSRLGGLSNKKLSLLTTSQYQFTILNRLVETIQLDRLQESASEDLLQFMYNQLTKLDAKEFAQLAGHNALALKVIGALLKERVPVVDLKKELKQNPIETLSPEYFRSEDQVRACISSSFNRLPNQLQIALVTLAQIPGTFDESDANAILNVTNSSVHESLTRGLTMRCLLEFEDNSNRYSLHSLIAAYAKEKEHMYIKPWAAERVVVRHYFRKFMDLAIRYDKEPLLVLKSYDMNQQNFHHICQTIIDSSNQGSGDSRKVTISSESVSQLVVKSDRLIHARMLPSQQIRWYKAALGRSKSLLGSQLERLDEHTETVCQVLCLLVEAMVKEGVIAEATVEVKRQKEIIITYPEKHRINLLIAICLVDSSIGDFTEANLECHREISKLLYLPLGHIENFYQLGQYYYLAGYAQQAYECYYKANKVDYHALTASYSEDPSRWSINVVFMLKTYINNANVGVARWHDWIRSTFELMTDKFEISPNAAASLFVLGGTLHKASLHGLALEVFFQAVKVQMEVFGEEHVDTLLSLRAIGQVYFDDGNYTSAIQFFNRSLSISKRIHGPDSRHTRTLLVRIGEALNLLNRADAIDYWKQALEIATRRRDTCSDTEMVKLLLRVADYHFDRLQPFAFFDYLERAYHIARELKETEQPDSSAARTVPSTRRELQSVDGQMIIQNLLPPFITKYEAYLNQLKNGFSEFARRKDEDLAFGIRMLAFLYYGALVVYGACCILALAICAYILLMLLRSCCFK